MRIDMNADTWNQIMTMGKNVADTSNGTRVVLHGIHIVCNDDGNCRAESCDGYIGGTYTFRALKNDFVPGECIIYPQAPRKYKKYENSVITLESDGENVTFSDFGGTLSVKEIKGKYIDFERVYPTTEVLTTVYLNPANLEKILKACKGEKLVKMEFRGGLAPVRIATADFNMLVLPVRCDEKEW